MTLTQVRLVENQHDNVFDYTYVKVSKLVANMRCFEATHVEQNIAHTHDPAFQL